MTRSLLRGKSGMKAKTNLDKTSVMLGTCSECCDDVLEHEEYVFLGFSPPGLQLHRQKDGVFIMHTDCCPHRNCNGNYEDVWCMDCGADYNNGRL